MDLFESPYIRPLETAENRFVQVLLTQFALKRDGPGAHLEVEVRDNAPAIWLRRGRDAVHAMMRASGMEEKQAAVQQGIDAVLQDDTAARYAHEEAGFPFRYVSGGALPVVRMGPEQYYCLFYRDIFPIGWNLASGMSDSSHEFAAPLDTVERELREELIVADPGRRQLYVFEGETGRWSEQPELALGRLLLLGRFRRMGITDFTEVQLPLTWLEGPDSVGGTVGGKAFEVDGCFLNINAGDFGIEVDRIAKIRVDPDAVLCDGEVKGGRLLDRVIGLFPVAAFNRLMESGATEFRPTIVFRGGVRYDGDEFERLRDAFLRDVAGLRSKEDDDDGKACDRPFDLCPATRSIIRRYLSVERPGPAAATGQYQVFVSYGHEDEELAETVYRYIESECRKRVFFSEQSHRETDYAAAIDRALDDVNCLVVVCSHPQHVTRRWPEYEFRARLLSFVAGCRRVDLPRPICHYEVVEADSENLQDALRRLSRFLVDCG